mmetsp:Transcript_4511/g.28687  ORF Transcript_4511/g.28687 Transcript_4511/m.28687 type:complete len:212 (-) Transcript_4511:667-1302(-)
MQSAPRTQARAAFLGPSSAGCTGGMPRCRPETLPDLCRKPAFARREASVVSSRGGSRRSAPRWAIEVPFLGRRGSRQTPGGCASASGPVDGPFPETPVFAPGARAWIPRGAGVFVAVRGLDCLRRSSLRCLVGRGRPIPLPSTVFSDRSAAAWLRRPASHRTRSQPILRVFRRPSTLCWTEAAGAVRPGCIHLGSRREALVPTPVDRVRPK